MARKPARMYRRLERPYTRREFMGGVPGLKIVHFDMGNPNGDFSVVLELKVKESCQIRDRALEAARVIANKLMLSSAGRANYHLKLNVYPHHVIRENKQATGAGADRVSDGMRKAFGKPVGSAAQVHAGQTVFTLRVNPQHVEAARRALQRAGHKLPSPVRIVAHEKAVV
ncbi:50S ribosomal protein L16 [Methermicoccus shengliensis]|uniref:Large ribosomal subunit protein uL16 n=1 Tax=Methermicoccus shengliensis TaxID=660064 RepID=A0A832RVJ9_9EURY|nr:50S ribosomal protein L16 [Methermicoccus shengliensis]KUK04073.1 MAG: 50S ribosomal protein L10e [Euryarchaeota archaeon 55_53]KUK29803.1 MAG: 50S ribosomal protein L10e [Methanosarcinales archeaon 56_1174]MDI3488391.1 large subunit ribosomal protein L10e [Methanosarcinales archaeon]MDN5295045.1 large subunit ribosomal protein L10e [Methanosarcinales archaeon]HIH69068.1 50S ribosomal protein L16 [Methermicoccus shengliensis]